MKKKFEAPVIIGALCTRQSEIPSSLKKTFAGLKPRFVLLPFCVEKRHLKNTIECMKLMDIAGLVLFGGHRKNIVPFLSHLDAESAKAGTVDIIIKKRGYFKGIGIKKDGIPVGNYCQTCVKVLTGNIKSI